MEDKCTTSFTAKQMQVMNVRFTMISGLLPLIDNKVVLRQAIRNTAKQYGCSEQTIRNYLALYQVNGTKEALAPKKQEKVEELSPFEKNIRWGLNKYYYTTAKRSLSDAYTLMIKERYYCGGTLLDERPSFWQFRYYYRKHNKIQNEIISREGLSKYQRDCRPLLAQGVQEYCSAIGSYMLDSTICDIYIVDDAGSVIGRPVLTAAVDGYSGLLCGYSLGWSGGMYSLRTLMQNILTDKVTYCRKFGIEIKENEWPCHELGGRLITDRGSEYISEGFSQLTELGIILENLPPFRPELKPMVEKFFDLIQDSFKPYLKNKGIVEKDFNGRGGTDYRKLACLTLQQFETILIHCIIYYNSKRIIDHFPYTKEMIKSGIKPYSADIWNWNKENDSAANLLSITEEELHRTLLPRTTGKFTRRGLMVHKLRYKAEGFNEAFLDGKTATVAYNPDNMNTIWFIEEGNYVPFELIDSRFIDTTNDEADEILKETKALCKAEKEIQLLAKVKLADAIEVIERQTVLADRANIKHIRKTRKAEQIKVRIGGDHCG